MCDGPLNVLEIVAIWLLAIAALVGLGLPLRRRLGVAGHRLSADGLFDAFWLGFAVALALLQVAHLALPVDGRATLLLLILGAAGWWSARREVGVTLRGFERREILVAALLLLAVAAVSLRPLSYYDTGLYHLTTLEWIKQFPAVPGLANLHGRLAYNSAFLLFAALFELGPWVDRSHHLANGLLLCVLLGQALRLASRPGSRRLGLVAALLLGPITARLLGGSVSSLSTDLAAFALALILTWHLLRILDDGRLEDGTPRGDGDLLALALLAAALGAIKLSLAIFGLLTLLVALVAWIRREHPAPGRLGRVLGGLSVAGGLVALPWTATSVVLSGYAVFPGGLLPFDVDWRVPRPLVVDEANWIYSRARQMTAHWGEILGTWDWLGRWLHELPPAVVGPLVVLGPALVLSLFLRRGRPRGLVAAIPAFVALVWWFLSVPNPRFAAAPFAVLAAVVLASALGGASPRTRHLAIVLAFAVLAGPALLHPFTEDANDEPRCEFRVPASSPRTTLSGDLVHVPDQALQTWKLPLPSTPYFKPGLQWRDPAALGAGFRLAARPILAHHEQGEPPVGFDLPPDVGLNLVAGWAPVDGENSEGGRTLVDLGSAMLWVDAPQRLRLRLRPSAMRAADTDIDRARLRISLNRKDLFDREMGVGELVELELPLAEGFNRLEIAAQETANAPRREDVLGLYRVRIRFAEIAFEAL